MFADFAETVDAVIICLFFFLVTVKAPTTSGPVTTAAPGPIPDISKFLSFTDRQTDRQIAFV